MRLLVLTFAVLCLASASAMACPVPPVGSANDTILQMKPQAGTAGFGPSSAITNIGEGTVVYDDANNQLVVCDGTNWVPVGGSGGGGSGPSGCVLEGQICDDGTILAGVINNEAFYAADADQGSFQWATVNQNNPGARSLDDGKANQADIVANKTLSQYPAFQACENLNRHGHTDWYLPSLNELNVLYGNKDAIGGFGTGWYWSSSESISINARGQLFSDGVQNNNFKTTTYAVRCVRR